MATDIEPAQTFATNGTASLLELHDRLDSLWAVYLHHLDQYTTAQKLLQKHMSAGFLSLARANFAARDGIRRYGKDYYHEKAIASKRVHVSSSGDNAQPLVEVVRWSAVPSDDISNASGEMTESEDDEPKQQPSPPATPAHEVDVREVTSGEDHSPTERRSDDVGDTKAPSTSENEHITRTALSMDPLRWFGILVPSELRSAQSSFVVTVEEPMATAVNAAKAMREAEVDIRKLRKEIKRAGKSNN